MAGTAGLTLETAALELGIDLVKDADLVDIAKDLAKPDSLPQGWSVYLDKTSKRRFYNNRETGESVWEHPLLGYFQGEIFMRRGGKAKLQEAEASNPCTEDEVGAMAEYLEVTPEDPSAVRDVARMAINAPLPPGWEDISDEATGEAAFKNFDSGEVVDQHPLDDYFFELVRRRRAAVRKEQYVAAARNLGSQKRLSLTDTRTEQEQEASGGADALQADEDALEDAPQQMRVNSQQRPSGQETVASQQLPRPSSVDSLDALEAKIGELGIHHEQGNGKARGEPPLHQNGAPRVAPASAEPVPAAAGKPWGRSSVAAQPKPQADEDDVEADVRAALKENLDDLQREMPSRRLGDKYVQRTEHPWAPDVDGATGHPVDVANHDDEDDKVEHQGRRHQADRQSVVSSDHESFSPPKRGGRGPHSNGDHKDATSHPIDPDSPPSESADLGSSLRPESGRKQEHIKVCIRARPLKKREKTVWEVDKASNHIKLKDGAAVKRAAAFYADTEHQLQLFQYSSVFEESDSTRQVYESTVQDIVAGTLSGYNGTVFAYGQTGSGKTHTIVGKRSDPGVLMMGVEELFEGVAKAKREDGGSYVLRVGILEIYNEEMRDLGAPSQAQRLHQGESNRLQIKEDPVLGIKVAGLHEEVVDSVGRVKVLLDRGMSRRQTAATKMNDTSSRSHTIFRITIEFRKGTAPLRFSTLNFVDLAGSERLDKTENTGARAGESAHINGSLLMLGNVISKLAEGRGMDHIPYRNSKLTRILQPSLGGNARTAVIATVNPATSHADETSHTLRFASRAMAIVNTVQINEVLSDAEVIQRYKTKVAELSKRLRTVEGGESQKELRHLRRKCVRLEEENERLTRKLEYVSNNAAVGNGAGASPPRTPPDLNLPKLQPRRGAAQINDANKALASIGRVANLSKARGLEGAAGPEAVVQAVRIMRAERDELRRRDEVHRQQEERLAERMEDYHAMVKERETIADVTAVLEDLVGGRAPRATLPERLRESVETTAMLAAEMSSMQRQHASIAVMLKQEEANRAAIEGVLTDMQERAMRLSEVEKSNYVLQEEKLRAVSQRDDFARQLGKDPAGLFPPGSETMPGEQAFKYAEVLEKRMKVFENLAAQREKERVELKKELSEWASIPHTGHEGEVVDDNQQVCLVGSAAVRAARLANREAGIFARRAEEAEGRGAELKERVTQLEQELGELSNNSVPQGEDDEAVMVERMKKRVFALSREVASLTRERDDLLTRLMDNNLSSNDAQVWSAGVHSSVDHPNGLHPMAPVRQAPAGPASASAAEASHAASSMPVNYSAVSSAPPQGENGAAGQGPHLLPMIINGGQHYGHYHHHQQQQQYYNQPVAAWQQGESPEKSRGNNGKKQPKKKAVFDNRPVIPESVKMRQKAEDRALRDPYYGRSPVLEEIEIPAPGQKRKGRKGNGAKRPMVRTSRDNWHEHLPGDMLLQHDSYDDGSSDTLRLRQRLVAAERSRAELAARAAEEKRQLELKLAARERAAIAGKGVDDVVRQKEAEAIEKAQLAEQYRIERDELSAAMHRMAEENASLKATMVEAEFKKGLGKT